MSNLFTAISVEQQAIVSGGFDIANYSTLLNGISSLQTGGTSSSFTGSVAAGQQGSLSVNTGGITTLATSAPSGFVIPKLTVPFK